MLHYPTTVSDEQCKTKIYLAKSSFAPELMSLLAVSEPDLAIFSTRNTIPIHVVSVLVAKGTHLVELAVAIFLWNK